MRIIIVFLIFGLASFMSCQPVNKEKENVTPNIIYILADDLGYGELGCYGQNLIETPNIDALAENGMRFTQHYAGAPVCAPSRCVLMTGQHSGHSYIRGNDELDRRGDIWNYEAMVLDSSLEGQRPLPVDLTTMAGMLKNAGYKTGCIGKWGLGFPGSESTPNKKGFDYFYGYNCQRMAHGYYPPFLWEDSARVYLNNELIVPHEQFDNSLNPLDTGNYSRYSGRDYAPDLMFDKISDFINDNHQDQFFLMWNSPLPHVALQAPQRWVDYYVEKFGDEQPYLGDKGYLPCRYPHATYAAMISYLDENIGSLVQLLEEKGIADSTLIIFSSDNGPAFTGGADPVYFNSGGVFHEAKGWGKASVQEGGIRVPMIVSWPGTIKSSTTSSHVSSFYDVMPTLADLVGIESPVTDGISFASELLGRKQEIHPFLYWEYPEYGGFIAVRKGDWKGIIRNVMGGNEAFELYNLAEDPQEENNIASQYPEMVERLQGIIDEQHTKAEVEKFRFPFDKE